MGHVGGKGLRSRRYSLAASGVMSCSARASRPISSRLPGVGHVDFARSPERRRGAPPSPPAGAAARWCGPDSARRADRIRVTTKMIASASRSDVPRAGSSRGIDGQQQDVVRALIRAAAETKAVPPARAQFRDGLAAGEPLASSDQAQAGPRRSRRAGRTGDAPPRIEDMSMTSPICRSQRFLLGSRIS